jgi:hypothetical protein
MSSRIVKEVHALGEEHRNFLKRPFIYNKVDYLD